MRRWTMLVGIAALAALLRGWAVMRLPMDFDEPVYLEAASDYAGALRTGDLETVVDYAGNREHPALVKLLYGLATLPMGEDPGMVRTTLASRALSALFGLLAVSLLAAFDPLAGGLLAVHTLTIKYTGQAYLEALPHLASIGAVLAFSRVRPDRGQTGRSRWLWLSALALGVTAASKFTYLPVILPILYLAIWEKRVRRRDLLLYGAVALAAFWVLNPTLWRDPVGRLLDSLLFHARYTRGTHVTETAFLPWYQPLSWLARSGPSVWHPDVFFYFALDGPIFLLALPGLYWEWRQRRWVVVWIVSSIVLLLLWPTRWPQYTLVVTPALCLAASSAARHGYRAIQKQEEYREWFRLMIPRPPLAFWILTAIIAAAVAVGYTLVSLQLTLGRLNCSSLNAETSPLPSNTVYAIVAEPGDDPDREMVLGSERGAAIWSPSEIASQPDRWTTYTAENSSLPHDRVLAVAHTGADVYFGTQAGLARLSGDEWQVFDAADVGLPLAPVYALAVGHNGRLWVGAGGGAAVYDGQSWTPFTMASAGWSDERVLSLAIQPHPDGDRVWFGGRSGVSRLDTRTGEWRTFDDAFDPHWGGVPALLLDSQDRLWAGTFGGGLGLWDGATWQFYRTSNSGIPFNTVLALAEVEPGVLWIGAAPPTEVGGVLAEFDGETWKTYTPRNSGFSGAEPLSIARDAGGRWWIGTRTAGVDVYHPGR